MYACELFMDGSIDRHMSPCEGENLHLPTAKAIVSSVPEDRVLPCWHHGYIMAIDYISEAVGGDLRVKKERSSENM